MMDFACKQFNINDILKCGLGLSKAELRVLNYFFKNSEKTCTTTSVAKKLKLDLTTIQKAVKKLTEKEIITRRQRNLPKGGYIFTYESKSKTEARKIIKNIIKQWTKKVEEQIDCW